MTVVWVPYSGTVEAEWRLGRLPDGVELDYYRADGDDWPRTADQVEYYVLPYMKGPTVLSRAAEMPRLRAVQTLTAGYEEFLDHLPPGVTLCNAAGVHDASTAELALALILASGRKLDQYVRDQAKHAWQPVEGRALADQRVLIVGYGRIGEAIERRLTGFEVGSLTRVARSARSAPVRVHAMEDLHDLLPQSDIVILIAPLNPQTEGMIGERELALLPPGALLVNVARGKLVDTDALLAAVADGRVRAALDVVDPEPLPSGNPLWDSPHMIITPHIGGRSTAFPPRADRLVKAQLERFAAGEPLHNVVVPGR